MIIRQFNRDHLYRMDKVYSSNRLQEIIQEEGIKITEIKVESLKWMLKFDMPNLAMSEKSDLTRPIVVILDKGQVRVVDGYHRFIKAVETGVEKLPAHLIQASHLEKAVVSMEELQRNMYEPDPYELAMRKRFEELQAQKAKEVPQLTTEATPE